MAIVLCALFSCKKTIEEATPAIPFAEGKSTTTGIQKHGRGAPFYGAIPSDEEMNQYRVLVGNGVNAGPAPELNVNNKLGMWLWYLEGTSYTSHGALADKLKSLGVKRVYVKVADGGYNPSGWPEVDDPAVVNAYKTRGLEVWAWSYNYPGNEVNQAKALFQAAKAGYQGYVTDIEIEFDRTTTVLESLLAEFVRQKNAAITAGHTTSAFKFYCTTWGNPKDHGMRVDLIDKYVDAHMPQTYVEVWGSTYMANAAQWISAGTQEYRQMGAVKPVHHIASAEKSIITATQLNTFINASGGETSIWRIPGGGTSLNIWNTLAGVNWTADFGTSSGQLTVNVPAFIQTNTVASFTGTATGTITKVQATADGFSMGAPVNVVNGSYTINYTFNTAGTNRNLVITGLNSSNTAVTSVSRTITVNSNSNFLNSNIPASIQVGVVARFAGTASSDVKTVKAYTDGFYMKEAAVTNGIWSLEYTYNTAGANRQLQFRGYNAAGAQIATNTYPINVTANTPYVTGVPYFYQYSNTVNPSGSCQNTTIAMMLKYYAIKEGKTAIANAITVDDISSYWGTSKAQTVEGYVDLFNREAAFRGINVRDRGTRTATFTKVRDLLAQGKPVVVHGYMTSYGHVVSLLGYDAGGYYCNDPAGKWNQVTYAVGGYSGANATEGIGVKYGKTAFEAAVSPDGLVWLHEFYYP